MSLSKEAVVLVVVANLVLTTVVVAGAFLVFPPQAADVAPVDTAALEESIARLTDRVENADRRAEERLLELTDRLSEVESRPRTAAAPAGSTIPEALNPEASSGALAEDDPTRKFMEGIGQMIKQQAKKQRDSYIQELNNPTEKSESRRTRQFKRMVSQIAGMVELDERDQAEVERILREVDDQRREDFKGLVASKPTTDDITYDEVKEVLDKSYEDESKMIANSLTTEQAEAYEKTSETYRQMIYMGAQSAFPGKPAE
jgi:molybdopterin-biosynthesis enzyme MoeA-like protein